MEKEDLAELVLAQRMSDMKMEGENEELIEEAWEEVEEVGVAQLLSTKTLVVAMEGLLVVGQGQALTGGVTNHYQSYY